MLNKALLYLLLLTAVTTSARADDTKKQNFVSLSHENDNLGGGSDRYYTSGARATWYNAGTKMPEFIEEIAEEIPSFDINETTGTFYSIGQNLYTPADITQADQPENDRPWAGFLYGSIGLATLTQNQNVPDHIDELEFTLGIVGPEALGEDTQKFVHKNISHSPDPKGWDNQLKFEPVFALSWQRRIPYALAQSFGPIHTRIEPNFSVSLGTLRTFAGAGAMLVIGSSQNMDTPSRVRPAPPGTGAFATNNHEFNWQIFAGADARLVARDIFLDGNTFRESYDVDKKPLVGDASAGFSLMYDDYRLSYTLNARSKEFDGQEEESVFGSVTLTKRF